MSGVTVATINLHRTQDRWLRRRELLVSELLDRQPDLISLQEIDRPVGQGRWLRNQINSRLTGSGRGPYRLVQQNKRHPIHGFFESIGILSKLPIVASDALSLGYGGRVALRAHVERSARVTLDFVAVHLHNISADHEARLEQVMLLDGWLNEGNPAPLQIIAGDFNEVPGGPAIAYMKQRYRSAMVEHRGYEPLATFPTALVRREDDWSGCLDFIFLSNAVKRVEAAEIICRTPADDDPTLYPSDHVGLMVTLDLGDEIH